MKKNSDPKFDLVFLTASEMPSLTNLHASQVLKPAIYLSRKGFNVTWIAAIPIYRYLVDLFLQKKHISKIKSECSKEGIDFYFSLILLPISYPVFFYFRHLLFRKIAISFLKRLKPKKEQKILFHARSYYAAQLALEMKKQSKFADCWRISFDMRSILPEELALVKGLTGMLAFSFFKQWEYEILKQCDVSFLPLNYARDRIKKEVDVEITYAPIQGFDRELGWEVNFDRRWKNKRIGYAGTFGMWNDPGLLAEIFQIMPNFTPKLAISPHPQFEGFDCKIYSYDEMLNFYDDLIALVVPGAKNQFNYFYDFKMRCNFFSTKAAEALSRGVPLIVSSQLAELAEFVQTHRCGLIYNAVDRQIIFPCNQVYDEDMWKQLTCNAIEIGKLFTQTKALEIYVNSWQRIFERAD